MSPLTVAIKNAPLLTLLLFVMLAQVGIHWGILTSVVAMKLYEAGAWSLVPISIGFGVSTTVLAQRAWPSFVGVVLLSAALFWLASLVDCHVIDYAPVGGCNSTDVVSNVVK